MTYANAAIKPIAQPVIIIMPLDISVTSALSSISDKVYAESKLNDVALFSKKAK